jgi:glycosyltransferase involved in cell wall biosynthesis
MVPPELPWEVIVVNNASTDNTATVAQMLWPNPAPAPLRVIDEPQPGQAYARQRGLAAATYDWISFVDDDNWVCPQWVSTIAEIFLNHPEVGAIGGTNIVTSDHEIPKWFASYQEAYAVGPQGKTSGDVTQSRGFLFGAGLSLRKSAWRSLIDQGFCPLLSGRQGKSLASGDDYELCLALQVHGWRLWYDTRLCLQHYMSASRLRWSYLRQLSRQLGAASVGLDAYTFLRAKPPIGAKAYLMRFWWARSLITLLKILRHFDRLLLFALPWEGDSRILQLETNIGRFSELLQQHQVYHQNQRAIESADWQTT